MLNPFEYGGVVGASAFCNRTEEVHDILRAAENGDRLFVFAERRMGKTSIARQVLDRLDPQTYLGVYIDLWPTDGVDSFIEAMARGLTEAGETKGEKMLATAKSLFTRLQPSLTLDREGNPMLRFGIPSTAERSPALEEVLDAPVRLAQKRKRQLVIVLDEFQQALSYESDQVERSLRSAVQNQKRVAWLFLGSRRHLIGEMFLDDSRPLYRSAGHYPLGPIATEHWVPFIVERFEQAEKTITTAMVEQLCALTEGHPFYTQHLAHALWEGTPAGSEVTADRLDNALETLLKRESYAFATRWETLTRNQQRFLRGLATSPPGIAPFSSDFIRTNGLRTPSTAQRAAESLLKLDLIDRENGSFVIIDRFLKLWIGRMG